MFMVLLVLSLLGGFCSGLLGVGGAVLLIPLLLAVPPLAGVGNLTMHEVSALTMIQVFASSTAGCVAHRRNGFADLRIILTIGLPMSVCAFAGATFSKTVSSDGLLLLFGMMIVLAFGLLIKRTEGEDSEDRSFDFNRPLSILSGAAVGVVSGMVGAGGGFVLIPVMIRILRIPIRAAVGSSLGIVFIGALMGSLGKIVSLQVPWQYLLPILAGSLPASLAGARVSKRLAPSRLRHILLGMIFLILLKTWRDILRGFFAGA